MAGDVVEAEAGVAVWANPGKASRLVSAASDTTKGGILFIVR